MFSSGVVCFGSFVVVVVVGSAIVISVFAASATLNAT